MKVFNFPWQTTLMMKMTRWLPDWLMARTMASYNENPPPAGAGDVTRARDARLYEAPQNDNTQR